MASAFLLALGFENDPEGVRVFECQSVDAAMLLVKSWTDYSRWRLQVVAFTKSPGWPFFSERFGQFRFPRSQWFHFVSALKHFFLNEQPDLRLLLKQTMGGTMEEPLIDWPPIVMTPAERRAHNSKQGHLPRFVRSADDFVLWAVEESNGREAYCFAKQIVEHPANKRLYSKSTIYNALNKAKVEGLVQEEKMLGVKVLSLTSKGCDLLSSIEALFLAEHKNKSVSSLCPRLNV